MARRPKQPTTKEVAMAALVIATQAKKAAAQAQRRLKKLEQDAVSENVIGFRVEQEEVDPPDEVDA